MKKIFGVSFLAFFLAACADSGQGTPPSGESGTSGYCADATNPVVSTNAVFETPAKSVPIPKESEAKPQPGESHSADRTAAAENPGTEPKEQGSQVSPEPRTGDDANPDSVNPRQ